jgi:hypothetical protein
MSLVKDLEAAKRLARAIVSDVALYNQNKVKKGIEEDNLFEILNEEIEEGRKHYLSRVSPEIAGKTNFYDIALVDVLIKQWGKVNSKIW